MNRIIDNALLEDIEVPELQSVEFADDLRTAFDNINKNFATLANHNFIKGDPGKSVYIKSVNIYEGEELTEIGKSLESFLKDILGKQDETITAGNTTLNFWDNFTKETAGSLQLIYNSSNDSINEEDVPFSSLQYVFLDGRFWNESIGKIDLSTYDGIDDKSCIIVYDGEKFESLSNALPTLYYEHSVGLCWKINGKKTGIPVQGIAGKDGKNAIMHIVKVKSIDADNKSEVIEIFENQSGYININDKDININDYDKSSALIIDENSKLYFGVLFIENDKLNVKCDQSSSLNDIQSSVNVDLALKNIKLIENTENPSHLKGLFIPINNNEEQSVHLISASSVTNVEGLNATSETSDVIFTPIKDINQLKVDADNPLNVEKYLYVKVNKDFSVLEDAKMYDKSLSDYLKEYNYCIKYKLKCIVTDKEDTNLNPEEIYGNGIFGVVDYDNNEITLTKDNVTYYNGDDYKNTLPTINSQNPLYVWEQCAEGDNFDVDELKKHETFNIPIQFKTICTRTFTPGISSQIFWFNPLEILESLDNTDNIYKIKGWRNNWNSQDKESLFKILKFVPIFIDKDFHVSKDTAINFNYNVNITGCNEDNDEQINKRNLTVHGDINCDNINVYKITATGGIDNVITPNTICGDDGINIGKGEDKYNFNVDKEGNIKASALDLSGDIEASNLNLSENINASNLNLSGDIEASNLTIKSEEGSNSSVSFEDITEFNISGNENNYNDKSYTDEYQITTDISSLSKENISKLPSVYTENGNIVITDQSIISPELYYYGMPKLHPNDIGTLETGNLYFRTDEIDFDNAKRFTFNRIKNKTYNKVIHTKLIDNSNIAINDYSEKLISAKSNNSSFITTTSEAFEYNTESGDDINKYILEKFEITADENDKLINSANINISFNKNYICHINLRGRGVNSSFPYLSNSSSMKLMLYYEDLDKNLKFISEQTYNFSGTETSWNNNVYDKNGRIVNTTRESNRIKSYCFKPNNFTINKTSDAFNAIKEINNNGESVKLYVIPKFIIGASSSKSNLDESTPATIKYIEVYFPVSNSKLTQTTQENKLILTNENIPINDVKIETTANARLTYGCVSEAPENKINSTTICKDGVLFRASDYMFGLGYSKDSFLTHDSGYLHNENKTWENTGSKTDEPILFYYKSVDAHDMQTSGEEIAKKINVIPLDDLFTAIQLLKTKFSDDWSDAKNNNIFA